MSLSNVIQGTGGIVFDPSSVNTINSNFAQQNTNNSQFSSAIARAVAPVSVTSGTGATLSSASIVGGAITRSGPSAVFTDTTDTASNIIAQLPAGLSAGYAWELNITNQTAWHQTIAAGSGVTLSGPGLIAVAPYSVSRFVCVYTAANSVTITQLAVVERGVIARQLSSAGVSPGATAADNVIAVFTIPANYFDLAGRALVFSAAGVYGATSNNKRVKIIFNPSTAVVGSTVGTGGTVVADTTTVTTNAGAWFVSAQVSKYGSNGSNTQLGTSIAGLVAPALPTATESGAILVAVTGNATTTAGDIVLNLFDVNAVN